MSMYLSKSSCISYQSTLEGDLKLTSIGSAEKPSLVEPAYKELLKPALLRRMSKVLKMGNYAAKALLTEAEGEIFQPDAIIVGTGLGCIKDTIVFLDEVLRNNEETLAPTAFIQSTHNSIAGQIALMLQNYRYNMTIVQQSLSFEMALLDTELQLNTGAAQSVLVGCADELTPNLENLLVELAASIGQDLPILGEGAAFFIATSTPQTDTVAEVKSIVTLSKDFAQGELLEREKLDPNSYDLILNGGFELGEIQTPQLHFKDYCGEFFTASGFAAHLALEAFNGNLEIADAHKVNRILILNTFGAQHGAIALERFEV